MEPVFIHPKSQKRPFARRATVERRTSAKVIYTVLAVLVSFLPISGNNSTYQVRTLNLDTTLPQSN